MVPAVPKPPLSLEIPGLGIAGGQATIDRIADDLKAMKSWMDRQSEVTERILAQQARLEHMLEGTGMMPSPLSIGPVSPISLCHHGKEEGFDADVGLSRQVSADKASRHQEKTEASASQEKSGSITTRRSIRQENQNRTLLERITESIWFEYASAVVIILHCVFIGAYVEYAASHGQKVDSFIKVTNYVLVVVFVLEVALKLAVERKHYFTGHEKAWNCFDFGLVGLVFVELLFSMVRATKGMRTILKIAEIIRTARVLRIFRILNFSATFKVIIAKIFSSITMLFWVMVLLGMLIFTLAVVFTQGSNDFLNGVQHDEFDLEPEQEMVRIHFGSISRSAFTLFKAISCGMLWGDAWNPLVDIGGFYAGLFVFYIALTDFALLNIITGIFVDASLQTGMHERDLLEEKQRKVNEQYEAGLREIFEEIDDDGNNMLSLKEFEDILAQNPELKVYMQALAIDASDAKKLFQLLDRDGSGQIELTEFLDGCKKIRGEAKSADIHALLKDSKWMRSHITTLAQKLHGLFTEVQDLRLEWAARP